MPSETNHTLTSAEITAHKWRFYHAEAPKAWNVIEFHPDGTIGIYSNENESTWRVVDGHLALFHVDGRMSVVFTDAGSRLQG